MSIPTPRSRTGPMSWSARIGTVLLAAGLQGEALAGRADEVSGEIVVRLRAGADIAPLLVKHQLTLLGRFGDRPIYRVKALEGTRAQDKAKVLAREPTVRMAEPNVAYLSPEDSKNVAWAIGNETDYVEQWAWAAIRLPQAHRQSTGAGIRVAVLDTGVDLSHPALAGRLLPGFDFVDFDADPSETGSRANRGYGHGTHVAGVVAVVAPDAKIMPLRVLDADGAGNAWVLAEAMLHAVDPDGDPRTDDGAHVINLSLSSLRDTRIFKTVAKLVTCKRWRANAAEGLAGEEDDGNDDDVAFTVDKQRCGGFGGAIVVAAAGNRGTDRIPEYPAAEAAHGLVSVGASARRGWLAEFSNFGWVQTAAPGDGVTSTIPGGGYSTWSGTSMAAPMVAGVAALLRAIDRQVSVDQIVHRVKDRGSRLCGTKMRELDAAAVLTGEPAQGKVDCKLPTP